MARPTPGRSRTSRRQMAFGSPAVLHAHPGWRIRSTAPMTIESATTAAIAMRVTLVIWANVPVMTDAPRLLRKQGLAAGATIRPCGSDLWFLSSAAPWSPRSLLVVVTTLSVDYNTHSSQGSVVTFLVGVVSARPRSFCTGLSGVSGNRVRRGPDQARAARTALPPGSSTPRTARPDPGPGALGMRGPPVSIGPRHPGSTRC